MKKYTILLVDDDKGNLQTLIQYLDSANYHLLSAANGQIADKIAKKSLPDLIVTDWDMPVMSGIQLIEQLKTQEETKDIPSIIVTGLNISPENLQFALDTGAVDYIRKPINQVELLARIKSVLNLFDAYNMIKGQKQEIEDQKNRELSTKTLQIHQKNQLLNLIADKLSKFIPTLNTSDRSPAKEIQKLIQNNMHTDGEWENFKLHFEKVHPNFFHKLQDQGRNLTQNDLKHCAYIRIGLSAKEVANLLNIDYQSARAYKTRIKKKIGLDGAQTLDEFIKNLS